MAVGDIHVVPIEATVQHDLDEGCVCVPRIEPVLHAGGTPGWMLTHRCMDPRDPADQGEPLGGTT